ncbi:MFS transporter [Sphingoaurantiacus capsulatus]|uniref:MFS transporter n=1 Tax=Sphingoaurantiacus capsulatus TaxID=1771310 RepID=A0ABV7X7M6_9SPHN
MTSVVSSSPTPIPQSGGFSAARAWYVVAILAALYGISFIDRYMLALVVDPVSKELGIGDTQMGVLLGAGFAMVYALAGLPLAQMIDQFQRRLIVVAGVLLWSGTTMASAFAHDFMTLALCRAGIAIGEAVLTPAAISLIADMFPQHKRALPVSVYGVVATVMGTGAFVVGGAALDVAQHISFGGLSDWRIAFILVGSPGIFLALLMLWTVDEPAREITSDVRAQDDNGGVASFFAFLKREWRLFLPYFVGTGAWSLCSASILAWAPTFLVRAYGLEAAEAGYLFGTVGVPVAIVGSFLWPLAATKLEQRGRRDGIILIYLLACLIGAPMFALMALAPTLTVTMVAIGFLMLAMSSNAVLAALAMQTYGPSRMRGRLMALNLMFKSIIGLSGGPVLVALFASNWEGDPRALGYGMMVVGLVGGALSVIFLALALPGARRRA